MLYRRRYTKYKQTYNTQKKTNKQTNKNKQRNKQTNTSFNRKKYISELLLYRQITDLIKCQRYSLYNFDKIKEGRGKSMNKNKKQQHQNNPYRIQKYIFSGSIITVCFDQTPTVLYVNF